MELPRFSCIEEWLEAKGIRNGYIPKNLRAEYADIRSLIWNHHYQSLSEDDKALLDSGKHPCENAERYEAALEYVQPFIQDMALLNYVKKVSLDYYHGNTLVLTVHLERPMHWSEYRTDIPELYRGVQVFTAFIA
ncbi:MAG: hypothetical protein P8178_08140 [Candidatus Thiodiazotropha sp.]